MKRKKKVLVYGVSIYFQEIKVDIEKKFEIVGYIDTYRQGYLYEKRIYSISEIDSIEYEKIIICSMYAKEILDGLIDKNIPLEKIVIWIDIQGSYLNNNNIIIDKNNDILYNDKSITIKANNGISVIRETFIFEQYNYNFSKSTNYIVIDVGVNIGDTAIYFANKVQVDYVIGYEPFKETYRQACENIELNARIKNKIKIFNYGLGKENCKLKMKFDEENNSINTTVNGIIGKGKSETIEIIDVCEEFKRIFKDNEKRKFVLKIDCEGAEYEIFERLNEEKELLNKFEAIIMEWHEKDPKTIVQILEMYGYKVFVQKTKARCGMIYAMKND